MPAKRSPAAFLAAAAFAALATPAAQAMPTATHATERVPHAGSLTRPALQPTPQNTCHTATGAAAPC